MLVCDGRADPNYALRKYADVSVEWQMVDRSGADAELFSDLQAKETLLEERKNRAENLAENRAEKQLKTEQHKVKVLQASSFWLLFP